VGEGRANTAVTKVQLPDKIRHRKEPVFASETKIISNLPLGKIHRKFIHRHK
jgi:hypothetical protein